MTPLFRIMTALWALEDVLAQKELTDQERSALIRAVMEAIAPNS